MEVGDRVQFRYEGLVREGVVEGFAGGMHEGGSATWVKVKAEKLLDWETEVDLEFAILSQECRVLERKVT